MLHTMKTQGFMNNCGTTKSDELAELKKISKILLLANARTIEIELLKYATTDERKKVWVLIDGKRSVEDLIKYSGMKRRTVYDFLKILENSELIECTHGEAPKKLIDFVPASWADLVKIDEPTTDEQPSDDINKNPNENKSKGDLGKWVK
jgi:hypothetical protein